MGYTSQLDAITSARIRSFTAIALADGGTVTVRMPGEDDQMEVFLSEEVTAEGDDEAWERPLECDEFEGAALFLGVPVQAVRALIAEHGGALSDGGLGT
jgi:hypothetical protein